MDKIIQTAVESLITRVEELEEKVDTLLQNTQSISPEPNKNIKSIFKEQNKNEFATEKQLKFLEDLNVTIPEGLSKEEAKVLIRETLRKRDNQKGEEINEECYM